MTTTLATLLTLVSDFQHACRTDDWSALAAVLAEDVTLRCAPLDMPGGGTYEGREATLFFFLAREHLLVRPLGSWELATIDGPTVHGDTARGIALARLALSDPGTRLTFELRITSEEGRAVLIVEDWTPESAPALHACVDAHGATRGVRADGVELVAGDELALLTRAMERVERRVRSRNQIASAKKASDLGAPIEVQCLCSWTAPGLPPLSLEYALSYRFATAVGLELHERWEPAERQRLDAYLRAHGPALRKRAAARQA